MHRTVIAFGVLLAVAACSDTDDGPPAVPAAALLIGDDGANSFQQRVSPDGRRMAWVRPVDGQAAIFAGNIDGSDPVQLTQGVWDQDPIWSPDGRWIAYLAEGPNFDVFIVPAEGGEPRQLTSGPGADIPWYWLPDGSGVVFLREGLGPMETLVVPIDGGPVRPLLTQGSGEWYVALAPDGARAAVGVQRGSGNTIWLHDMATGESSQLTTEGLETVGRKPWSPDGRFIAYVSRRTGTSDLWIANAETGELRQLTTDIHNDDEPRWSPDGRWIAFRSDRGGQTDLWVVSAGGGQQLRLTDNLDLEEDFEWTPDGRSIFFTSRSGTRQLQVIPLDGAAPRDLVVWPGYFIEEVDLSPDGRTVLFQSTRSGNLDIWAVPFDGGEPTPLTTSPVPDEQPQFSPDGSMIAFHSHRGGSGDLWVMPAAGGEARQITDWPSNEEYPRWSPDGRMIAFVSNRDEDREEVWVIPAAGGEARRLTTNLGNAGNPRWSPDGSAIYVTGAGVSGLSELYRVAVDGGDPEPLSANPDIGRGELSPDGSHYAYAAFEGGWAYIEVIPTAGGPLRRLTQRTERVFQSDLVWSPSGDRLAVFDYVYAEDTYDVQIVTWPEGEWRQLTNTPRVTDVPFVFTPDGSQLLTVAYTDTNRIMAVSVADLLEGSAPGR